MDIFFRIVGYCAAVLTTLSFLPQAIKCIVTKKTDNISLLMYVLSVLGCIAWETYGIFLGDWPIIIANAITVVFSSTILVMKIVNLPKEKKTQK
jgi:MtN3 and saliva related transmembrane protein